MMMPCSSSNNWRSVSFRWQLSIGRLVVESDCAMTVQSIKDDLVGSQDHGLLYMIKSFLKRPWELQIFHMDRLKCLRPPKAFKKQSIQNLTPANNCTV
ncbi:hypothetical protein V6N11_049801 [Hibiscus sabdariffa]|uniref:RNase H type-1 domain-containing protein n=1 Tax=Hibiscus sabdariffa TaxID=183260 RepID=A0ABR2T852_9ROSI